ncbi:MAG: capsular polysaccharide transport system permease protein [Paracoccaceae bacterium]|jgi:capsular polysaccharide transport system permease protein
MRAATSSPLATHIRVVGALLRREMTTRYGRSAGGYFWAVAEPVGMVFMLSLVFSAVAHAPPLGGSFIAFFSTGYIAFTFYRATAETMAGSLKSNFALLRFPNVNPYDAIVARLILQTLTNIAVALIVLGGAFALTNEPVRLDQLRIFGALGAATLLAAGVGVCNAVLFMVRPLWQQVFAIINRPLFLVSGVFFLPEAMPTEVQAGLAWNPLVHVISALRVGIYPVYHARYDTIAYPAALGLGLLLLGLLLLRRHRRRLSSP